MNRRKVAFVDFWKDYNFKESLFYKTLQNHYQIELVEKEYADYVFFSVWGDDHWYVPEHCVKIFWTGENRTPDFNACDYALGFERMEFRDRYMRLPLYYFYPEFPLMEKKHIDIDHERLLKTKSSFCSFTVSNKNCQPRIDMFNALNNYKTVDSGGRFMNNVGGPIKDKFSFDLAHKFSIAYENFSYNGYITEKIVQAFAAKTIPIYWGDPQVTDVFNKKAFINVKDYGSIDEVVEIVKRIDKDDSMFLSMLSTPALVSDIYSLKSQTEKLEHFLIHIFDQPLESAKRRTRYAKIIAERQRRMMDCFNEAQLSWYRKMYHKIIRK